MTHVKTNIHTSKSMHLSFCIFFIHSFTDTKAYWFLFALLKWVRLMECFMGHNLWRPQLHQSPDPSQSIKVSPFVKEDTSGCEGPNSTSHQTQANQSRSHHLWKRTPQVETNLCLVWQWKLLNRLGPWCKSAKPDFQWNPPCGPTSNAGYTQTRPNQTIFFIL